MCTLFQAEDFFREKPEPCLNNIQHGIRYGKRPRMEVPETESRAAGGGHGSSFRLQEELLGPTCGRRIHYRRGQKHQGRYGHCLDIQNDRGPTLSDFVKLTLFTSH